MGAGYVLTRVKVNKYLGSLAVSGGVNSNGTRGTIGCDGVISFLGGLYIRAKLYLKMLAEFQTTATDDTFGDDGAGHPVFSSNRVNPKYCNKD